MGLYEAHGRYAAETVQAKAALPASWTAPWDAFFLTPGTDADTGGYAVAGNFYPGAPVSALPAPGTVVRVDMGTTLPEGGALVPVDKAVLVGTGRVRLPHAEQWQQPAAPGDFIQAGTTLVSKGERITAPVRALLEACGLYAIRVTALPEVHLIVMGDELCQHGTPDVNGIFLGDFFQELGFETTLTGPLPDAEKPVRDALRRLLPKHLVVICGGTGLGWTDRTVDALRPGGIRLRAERLLVSPGGTTGFAVGKQGICLFLPGSPESILAVSELLLKPALAKRYNIIIKSWQDSPILPLTTPWLGESRTTYMLPGEVKANRIVINDKTGLGGLFRSPHKIVLEPGAETRLQGHVINYPLFMS